MNLRRVVEDALPQGEQVVVTQVQVDQAAQLAKEPAHLAQVIVGQLHSAQALGVPEEAAGEAR